MAFRWLLCCYLQTAWNQLGVCIYKIPTQHDVIVVSVLNAWYVQRVRRGIWFPFFFVFFGHQDDKVGQAVATISQFNKEIPQ